MEGLDCLLGSQNNLQADRGILTENLYLVRCGGEPQTVYIVRIVLVL